MTSRTKLSNKHCRRKSSDIGTPHYFHTKLSNYLWNWHVFQLRNESFNRNGESNAPHCLSESTDMTTISTCFITCMHCVRVCVSTCAQKKMTTICPPLSQAQHFAKQPDRTYRLHSSDCCWDRSLEAVFLRHANALAIETNTNPTLTFLLTTLHDPIVHFADWPRDGSTSPRFVYTVIVL